MYVFLVPELWKKSRSTDLLSVVVVTLAGHRITVLRLPDNANARDTTPT